LEKSDSPTVLKKAIGVVQLWAIAVGLVISGEYFGWNYGWGVSGTVGFLIATVLVTIMYLTFVFSFTELTTAIPHAGGPFAYAEKAFGPLGGLIAGYATLVEFLFATPPIALALGSYIHFLNPAFPVLYVAIGCYLVFTGINLLGIQESAIFNLLITILAVAELLLYLGIVGPHFQLHHFLHNSMPFGWAGVFAALPFAIWFYLGIEGVAMVAEEVKNPHRVIPQGYILGILTLFVLALGVMITTGGITDWKNLSHIDYPLPESIGIVLGRNNRLTSLFTGIGLFGLMASFHGLLLSASRQVFALARSRFLPSALSLIHPRTQTPHVALLVVAGVGFIGIFSGATDKLIVFSVLGAVVLYIVSMVSLLQLRRTAPELNRPFSAPFFPYFPLIALILAVVCLIAIVCYNWQLSVLFFGVLALAILYAFSVGKIKK
jgi:ethanolamine permease